MHFTPPIVLFYLVRNALSECLPATNSTIELPIHHVILNNQLPRRGIPLSVGTPPQLLSFDIHLATNDIWLHNTTANRNELLTPAAYVSYVGGTFDSTQSSSWSAAEALNKAGCAWDPHFLSSKPGPAAKESLQVLDIALEAFPFGLNPEDRRSKKTNGLGLGLNSTLLNTLYATGHISSKTWSLSMGLDGGHPETQTDGSVVLGGADMAKYSGPGSAFPFSDNPHCDSSLGVPITDIEMNFDNSTNHSIFTGSGAFARSNRTLLKACVRPHFPGISLPSDIWAAFVETSGSSYVGRPHGVNIGPGAFLADGVYLGDMTLTIAGSLRIRIPNHQLVLPDWAYDDQGRKTDRNSSTKVVRLDSLKDVDPNAMMYLGVAFLSSAYLSIDQDRGNFTLWQSRNSTDRKIVRLGPSLACKTTAGNSTRRRSVAKMFANNTGVINSTAASESPAIQASTTSSPDESGGLSGLDMLVKIILGIIGGTLAALALYIIWRQLTQRRKAARSDENTVTPTASQGIVNPRSELEQPDRPIEHPTQELPGVREPQELPFTPSHQAPAIYELPNLPIGDSDQNSQGEEDLPQTGSWVDWTGYCPVL